jgi:ATPase subunit of ABC transporter with duplicated ATPase domains
VAWLTEAARVEHLHAELLRRQQSRQALSQSWQIEATAREIRDSKAVESWLAHQLHELSGGER